MICIMIYGIGGAYNNEFVGCAHDAMTGMNLIHLIKLAGGYACSLHGDGLLDLNVVSGECSLKHARDMFTLARGKERMRAEKDELVAAS